MNDKVFEILDLIDNLDITKELNKIKKEILSDSNALTLIKNFNNAKELYEKYSKKEDFILAKKELLNNELINKFIKIQNEFNMLAMDINSRIKQIIGEEDEDNKR